jgi:anti-sigma factor (TIGR02949 family)
MTKLAVATRDDTPVLDCEQTVRRLWDYLDGQLGAVDLAAVDAHLASCQRCPPHFAFEQRFLDVLRDARAAVQVPDAQMVQALRSRVVAKLAAEGELNVSGGQS